MQVIIESRHHHENQLRELSIERTRFAFRRLSSWIPRVNVQFSDVNGPRGGLDKRCQVELGNRAAGKVVIVSLARDWRTALDLSLRRAAQMFKRSLQRDKKPLRGRSARLALDSQYPARP
ncbi:MAG: hypothetical protein C0428_07505 [Polaromonas sp.]|nr:hypothetical protein [Polaromonas sp.]